MLFSIMFFSVLPKNNSINSYDFLIETAKYADAHGFDGIWTPERHFDPFGAIFPNPAITSAAISMVTQNINIRVGSLVAPLYDTIRIVENWAMVDNLSRGRIGISFAPGWNINDFIFFPERYENRRSIMYKQIQEVRRLWRGEPFIKKGSQGETIELFIYPSPIQRHLPIWITSAGDKHTFSDAAAVGANILTHMIGQDDKELATKISLYRDQLQENGFDPSAHIVTVMLHTFINPNQEYVSLKAKDPLHKYMEASFELYVKSTRAAFPNNTSFIEEKNICSELLDARSENCFNYASLIGTPEKCGHLVKTLIKAGVDEIACLLDFGIDQANIIENLPYLCQLKDDFN